MKKSLIVGALVLFLWAPSFLFADEPVSPKLDNGPYQTGAVSFGGVLGVGGFAEDSAFSMGGNFNYFLTPFTGPGAEIVFSFGNRIHKIFNLTLRQYLLHKHPVHIYLLGKGGYFNGGDNVGPDEDYGGLIVRDRIKNEGLVFQVGPGLEYFFSENISASIFTFYRWYLMQFSEAVPDLTELDIGFSFVYVL